MPKLRPPDCREYRDWTSTRDFWQEHLASRPRLDAHQRLLPGASGKSAPIGRRQGRASGVPSPRGLVDNVGRSAAPRTQLRMRHASNHNTTCDFI
ncbi:hypothetical protein MTP99_006064 [Tenebrio molitor]|nr:hypothetical protein MTP99_006064 [Tenebrio molitor]